MTTNKLKCRNCGTVISKPFLDLGNSPESNNFLKEKQIHKPEIYYPLEVYHCPKCHLVQIREYQKPSNIFTADYAYHSSHSASWLAHCKAYAEMIIKRLDLTKTFGYGLTVLEIGSNDGYLLQYFKEKGFGVFGVDPAKGASDIAIAKGIPTDVAFFSENWAKNHMTAHLVICNNVIAHNPNLNDFVAGLCISLKPAGTITAEFPHLLKLMQGNQFDTIYQEHYSYFSLHAISNLFDDHGLEIFDVDELDTHGGSLRIYARHKREHPEISKNFIKVMDDEIHYGMLSEGCYQSFGKKVEETKRNLLSCLIAIKDEGKTIVGYGAPAKGNTLLNYCGIRTDFIDYVVDISPTKQGKFLPGTHIPVFHPRRIKKDKPDYLLVLPWNLKDEIMTGHSYIRKWGGKFIIPIPDVMII